MPPRILVISLTDIARDPRVDRQINFLLEEFEVVAAGLAPPSADVEFHPLPLEPPQGPTSTPEPLAVFEGEERALPLGHKLLLAGRRLLTGDAALARSLLRFLPAAVSEWVHWFAARLPFTRRAIAPYPRSYWMDLRLGRWVHQLQRVPADLILVNDAIVVPAGLAIGRGRPVVWDAREYAPSENAGNLRWRITESRMMRDICRQEVPRLAGLMTVSPGLVQAYHELTGVEADLVTNAPDYADLRPTPVHTPVRMVHWGGAEPQRRLELMIETMELLDDRFTLDLVLVPGDPQYIERLRRRASSDPRIRFVDPVPMSEVPGFGNQYDIGLYPLPPLHTNQKFALPNKFFEFVQARLAIAIGPSPDMARLAEEYDVGIVSRDFTPRAVADALLALTPERIEELKRNADRAAPHLSAEHNAETVRRVVREALEKNR